MTGMTDGIKLTLNPFGEGEQAAAAAVAAETETAEAVV